MRQLGIAERNRADDQDRDDDIGVDRVNLVFDRPSSYLRQLTIGSTDASSWIVHWFGHDEYILFAPAWLSM